MKIEIATLHYIRNYGSVLQTYATQKKLEDMGFEAEILDYVRPNASEDAVISGGLERKQLKGIRSLAYIALKKVENIRRNRVCQNFLDKYCHLSRHYTDDADLMRDPPQADIYCTGSDQTWNSEYNGGLLPAYFLDFAPEGARRIGYAVSIGMAKIPEAEREPMREYLRRYHAISVREDSAKVLLEDLGIPGAAHVLDPTLALQREEWEAVAAPRRIPGKYIFIYRLTSNRELERFAEKLSAQTGLPIVRASYYLTHLTQKGKLLYTPEVEDFLSLIRHAEYVLTDSFHCTAFSLNFNRNFFVFYPKRYSTRLESILTLTGTAHRVDLTEPENAQPIDYDRVNAVLAREREKTEDFLRRACC